MSKKKRLHKPRPLVNKRASPSDPVHPDLVRQATEQFLAKEQPTGRTLKIVYGMGENMSDALVELLEPFTTVKNGMKWTDLLVRMGMAAWNIAINGREGNEDVLADLLAIVREREEEPVAVADFDLMIDRLVKRKKLLFPYNEQLMLDYQFVDVGDGYHISVMYTLSPEMLLAAGEEEA